MTIRRAREKLPFDIDEVMRRIRAAVADVPDAAMFALRDLGYGTLFQQLVACIISIRTTDEVSLPTALALLKQAPTPADVAALDVGEIDAAIRSATFHEGKAAQIHAIARRAVEEFAGELPADAEVLQSFAGVGPKCANLALGVARDVPRISVDVHVWRVVNRWGYVSGRTPRRRSRRSNACCRRSTGSRSTGGSCRSGSTSARGCGRSARRVRYWSTAGRSA